MNRRDWWEGENVCVDREIIEEPEEDEEDGDRDGRGIFHMDMTMTSCRDGENFHECTTRVVTNGKRKTVVVKQACCYGHERSPGEIGCTKAVMKPVEETLEDLGAEEFLELLELTDMKEMVRDNNLTLFVPSDEAIEDFKHDMERELGGGEGAAGQYEYEISPKRRRRRSLTLVEPVLKMEDLMKGHMVEGFLDTSQMHDEDVVDTMAGGSKLRIAVYNTYPQKTVMANCARLQSKDHFAEGGLVHMVDRVITPAVATVGELVEADASLGRVAEALRQAGLMDKLKAEKGQVRKLVAEHLCRRQVFSTVRKVRKMTPSALIAPTCETPRLDVWPHIDSGDCVTPATSQVRQVYCQAYL